MKAIETISTWILFAIIIIMSGCMETTTNIFDDENRNNRPPQILLSGPTYDSLSHFKTEAPQLWVIAGDVDGSDDIAAVVLNISKVKIISLIVRPDDSTNECSVPFYADMDTIDITPFLNKSTFNIMNHGIGRSANGVYTAYLYYAILTEGGIEKHGDVFGENVKSCHSGYSNRTMLEQLGLYPPALSMARDVYVTYAQFLVSGISISVHDQSGASASVNFPDFYITFSNTKEDQTLP